MWLGKTRPAKTGPLSDTGTSELWPCLLSKRSVRCPAPHGSLQHALEAAFTRLCSEWVMPRAMPGGSSSPALHICWMQAGCMAGKGCPNSSQAKEPAAPWLCTEVAHYTVQPWLSHFCPDPSKGPAAVQHEGSQARLARSGFGN